MNMPTHITPIIKLTEGCNYSCSFCRYANHPNGGLLMDTALVKKTINAVVQHNLQNGFHHTDIIFHGGEPLLWGLPRFCDIMDYEHSLQKSLSVTFQNRIQTNGYLLNQDWASLFATNNFSIGISIDGPDSLNCHYGPLGGEESLTRVIKNLRFLEKQNISYGILSVITDNHYGKEKEFYDFWVESGIKNIGLCYCYNPEDGYTVNNQKLSSFLVGLFDLYFYGKAEMNIREFNDAIRRLISGRHTCCTNAKRKKCGSFLTITPYGDILFCDDYDLCRKSFLGNINSTDLDSILSSNMYQSTCEKCKNILQKCISCPVNDICGSGCARNDRGTENYFCETYVTLYNHIRESVLKAKPLDTP